MMRAAVFNRPGVPLEIQTVPDPDPLPDEAVLQVRSCGICGTDLHLTALTEGGLPGKCVLGHEFSGEVVALGRDTTGLRIGDRVAALPIFSCGTCAACLSGYPIGCRSASLAGLGPNRGGFAEYAKVQSRHCFRLPDGLTFEDGALIEPLAVSLHGVTMANFRPGSRVAVLGTGPIGLAAIWWARRLGAGGIVALAPSRRREQLALAMGADSFVPLDADAGAAIEAALNGAPDIVFECVGVPGTIDRAVALAAFGGTIVILGYCVEPDRFRPAIAAAKELRILFSIVYGPGDYRATIAALHAAPDAPRQMITDRISLATLPDAFEALRQRNQQCKVLLDPGA